MQQRQLRAEWMDDPGLDARQHDQALAGLARINRFSGTVSALWGPLRELSERLGPMRVMDLACGGGDVAVGLARCARKAGVDLHVHGCDRSPRALEVARECARRAELEVEFVEADLLGDGFPHGFDVYVNTLFLHHLPDEQATHLLRRMATGRAMILDDLRRTRAGYLLAKWGTRFLTRSPVVWNDAPISVQNAFSIEEVRGLLAEAGLSGAQLSTHWPQRFQVRWERD